MSKSSGLIAISPTPNPNAMKFVCNFPVADGPYTFDSKKGTLSIPLVNAIFDLIGIKAVHINQNYITVTKYAYQNWDILQKIKEIIEDYHPLHDKVTKSERAKIVEQFPDFAEQVAMNKILDEKIRPFLANDGGGLKLIDFKNNILFISYEGACVGCPSSLTGTLRAIEMTLQEKYPNIEVKVINE